MAKRLVLARRRMTRTLIDAPMAQSVARRCDPAHGPHGVSILHQPRRREHGSRAAVPPAPARRSLAVMKILAERDHIDAEMLSRGRARIAGSPIAARFARVADRPASAAAPAAMAWDFLTPDFPAIDIGEVDDRRAGPRYHFKINNLQNQTRYHSRGPP
jgi:hypothetical protein